MWVHNYNSHLLCPQTINELSKHSRITVFKYGCVQFPVRFEELTAAHITSIRAIKCCLHPHQHSSSLMIIAFRSDAFILHDCWMCDGFVAHKSSVQSLREFVYFNLTHKTHKWPSNTQLLTFSCLHAFSCCLKLTDLNIPDFTDFHQLCTVAIFPKLPSGFVAKNTKQIITRKSHHCSLILMHFEWVMLPLIGILTVQTVNSHSGS